MASLWSARARAAPTTTWAEAAKLVEAIPPVETWSREFGLDEAPLAR
jgi:hypothetical protein